MSATMVGLARERLAAFPDRARVIQSDGAVRFPVDDRSVDRVVATYVLDLMADADIATFLLEARRVLRRGGLLCLVSLTHGTTAPSRLVSAIWTRVYRLRAALVGGCRPIDLDRYLDVRRWTPEHRRVVVAWGVPSEVVVARVAGGS